MCRRARTSKPRVEVDLVGANSCRLVLASVKSFLGSRGVAAECVTGTGANQAANRRYAISNNDAVRQGLVEGACQRYGYKPTQLELRLYADKFADKHGRHREQIAEYLTGLDIDGGKLRPFGLDDVVPQAIELAGSEQYRDNAALVAIKVLDAAARPAH